MNLGSIIREKRGTVVDVRTSEEFSRGHVPGSLNIPLREIGIRLEELKSLQMPLLLCCASGGRSGQAEQFLSQKSIECCNAGSWLDVMSYQSPTP